MAEPHVVSCYWCTHTVPSSLLRGLQHVVTHEWLWFCDACPSISICVVAGGGGGGGGGGGDDDGDGDSTTTPKQYNQRLTISPRHRQDVQGLCIMDAGGIVLHQVRGMRRVTEAGMNECKFTGVVNNNINRFQRNNNNIEWFIDPAQRDTYNRMLRELLS